ncbi:MAG: bifunctional DNA-formamidopyrimidine glycosylase/DNA-(apurinic or apyrimidinic site) lyase [Jatrophihabitans sp.]
MPELPEVETVRAGLESWVVGRTIDSAEVAHPRAVRRHLTGAADFEGALVGATVAVARRRGKYLWLPLSYPDADLTTCLVGHLGMSGQLLVLPVEAPDGPHLRARFRFTDAGPELRFVDQRTFGGLSIEALVPTTDAPDTLPAIIAHIARDPMDPLFDDVAFVRRLRSRDSAVKRALLDQALISGVGNIYADEALWRTKVHGERPARALPRATVLELLGNVRAVLGEALIAGGTSFDSLYVNVNGSSGYFDRSLAAYGREGLPCPRCGAPIRRESFMNRSSFSCPRCQRRRTVTAH